MNKFKEYRVTVTEVLEGTVMITAESESVAVDAAWALIDDRKVPMCRVSENAVVVKECRTDMGNRCALCDHLFNSYEHVIELADGRLVDEVCFIEYAAEQLKARGVQLGFFGELPDAVEEDD